MINKITAHIFVLFSVFTLNGQDKCLDQAMKAFIWNYYWNKPEITGSVSLNGFESITACKLRDKGDEVLFWRIPISSKCWNGSGGASATIGPIGVDGVNFEVESVRQWQKRNSLDSLNCITTKIPNSFSKEVGFSKKDKFANQNAKTLLKKILRDSVFEAYASKWQGEKSKPHIWAGGISKEYEEVVFYVDQSEYLAYLDVDPRNDSILHAEYISINFPSKAKGFTKVVNRIRNHGIPLFLP